MKSARKYYGRPNSPETTTTFSPWNSPPFNPDSIGRGWRIDHYTGFGTCRYIRIAVGPYEAEA